MVRTLMALLFTCSPTWAKADIFQALSGVYGDPLHMAETCERSPQHLIFSQNYQRGAVQVFTDQIGPALFLVTDLGFSVLRTTARGIEIAFDDEEARTETGTLVVWEFRRLENPAGYCWGRPDWPEQRCINTVNRCEMALIS